MPKTNQGDEGEMGSASEPRGTIPGRTRGNAANLSREARVKGANDQPKSRLATTAASSQGGRAENRATSSRGAPENRTAPASSRIKVRIRSRAKSESH